MICCSDHRLHEQVIVVRLEVIQGNDRIPSLFPQSLIQNNQLHQQGKLHFANAAKLSDYVNRIEGYYCFIANLCRLLLNSDLNIYCMNTPSQLVKELGGSCVHPGEYRMIGCSDLRELGISKIHFNFSKSLCLKISG